MITLFTEQDMLSFAARAISIRTKEDVTIEISEIIDWNSDLTKKAQKEVNSEELIKEEE